ncbi:MAG: CDP-2,3-bis-(O-geranylgeranyl)-sn-glycerol synthase [Candidatus Micrarchaeota archaeon]
MVVFALPAYFANSAPVVSGGKTPLDGGMKLSDGNRLLGAGKTIRGFFVGVAAGTLSAILLAWLFPAWFAPFISSINEKIFIGFLLAFGALTGDVLGSFFKRRRGMKRGQPSLLSDKILFLITALFFAVLFYPQLWLEISVEGMVFLLVLTYVLHLAFNALAHGLKLKSVPW